MRLRDIMSEAVETIAPDATVDEARELMRRQDVRHLVVVANGGIAGVLSANDLRRAAGNAAVRAAMSAPVVTATPLTSIRQAANLMRGNHVSCLPVVEGEAGLVGIVTVADLLDLIGKGVTRERTDEHRGHRSYLPGR